MKVRIDRDLHGAIRERAELLGVSESEIVRRCVRRAVRCGVAVCENWRGATRDSVVATFDLPECVGAARVRAACRWALADTAAAAAAAAAEPSIDPRDAATPYVVVVED